MAALGNGNDTVVVIDTVDNESITLVSIATIPVCYLCREAVPPLTASITLTVSFPITITITSAATITGAATFTATGGHELPKLYLMLLRVDHESRPATGCLDGGMVRDMVATVTARACANIALVKYWGKRDARLNLPATGSLALSLAALVTETTVAFDPALEHDALELDGMPASAAQLERLVTFLDLIRSQAGVAIRAKVTSRNEFPTASGLASSASGFAALALAATRAAGLELSERELSKLARLGSGSAARSIFGGFVRMHSGIDHDEAYAEPVTSPLDQSIRMVVAVVGGGAPKAHSSRDAMEHTAKTSPYYRAWLDLVPHDLEAAEAALAAGDLERLGTVAEANSFAMHASAMAARPAIVYWRPATLAVIAQVRGLRECGVAAWATMDAGPHVKVITSVEDAPAIAMQLRDMDGVTAVTISAAGTPAAVVDASKVVELPPS